MSKRNPHNQVVSSIPLGELPVLILIIITTQHTHQGSVNDRNQYTTRQPRCSNSRELEWMMLSKRTQSLQTLYCWVDEEIEVSNHLPAIFASTLAVEVQCYILGIIHSLINRTPILNGGHVNRKSVTILNCSVQELNAIHNGMSYLYWVRLPSIQILQVVLEFLLQVFHVKRRDKASFTTIHHEVIEHLFLWCSVSVVYLISQLSVLKISQHESEIPRGSKILSEQIVVLCILTDSCRCQRHGQV